jgi:subtilisin family serine protease
MMKSQKILMMVAIPLSISASFGRTLQIPKAEEDLKYILSPKSQFVLKNAKGTLIGATSFLNMRPENWFNLSPVDGAEGLRTEETYKTFGLPLSEDIVVAVIDSGVDVNHEDLQGKIWINSSEIANDGIDNDQNGYIDDVFGWNFIGGSAGMAQIEKDSTVVNGIRLIKGDPKAQVDADTLEVTRELVRMKKLKLRLEELGENLTEAQELYFNKISKEVSQAVKEAQDTVSTFSGHLKTYKAAEKILKSAGLAQISVDSVRAFESSDAEVLKAKQTMLQLLTNRLTEARINRILGAYQDRLDFMYSETFNPRVIVGDDYSNQNERFYGNNDVIGPDSSHGTHVSGIIAASRDNLLGIKGVATNVKIMAIRVIPNGDERDKDVANGIRYAVDNGARIINMSFGKAYSPFKKVVDEAVKYAESKGVILIHAAGNDSKNNDVLPSFPQKFHRKENREMNNWLEIGASSFQRGEQLPAVFSNYGKKSVDVFAPGVDIFSTTPENTYDTYSGTSMATPAVAGAAALILSYQPNLNANELKALILDTSRRYPQLRVQLPGAQTKVLFSDLSVHGSVADVFEATKSVK